MNTSVQISWTAALEVPAAAAELEGPTDAGGGGWRAGGGLVVLLDAEGECIALYGV